MRGRKIQVIWSIGMFQDVYNGREADIVVVIVNILLLWPGG